MKVLIVVHYYPPHLGGMELVASSQASRLTSNGNDVTVLTSAVSQTNDKPSKPKIKIIYVPAWNIFERAMGVPFPIFSPSIIWKLYKHIKSADVVHIHDVFYISSLCAAILAFILRKPIVTTQHVALIPHPAKVVGWIQTIVYHSTGRLIFILSKKIAYLNSDVKSFIINLGINKNKLIFLPNGVDLNMFNSSKQVNKKIIRNLYKLPIDKPIGLFVGRFVPKKGFDLLLNQLDDKYHIAFAGGNAVAGYEGNNKCTFLGNLSHNQLASLYKAVDFFVLPSAGEGFPLTVQEAMASGLPVITSWNNG
jgi:glycosyltransferase involved in cell wall biosynthesis